MLSLFRPSFEVVKEGGIFHFLSGYMRFVGLTYQNTNLVEDLGQSNIHYPRYLLYAILAIDINFEKYYLSCQYLSQKYRLNIDKSSGNWTRYWKSKKIILELEKRYLIFRTSD